MAAGGLFARQLHAAALPHVQLVLLAVVEGLLRKNSPGQISGSLKIKEVDVFFVAGKLKTLVQR